MDNHKTIYNHYHTISDSQSINLPRSLSEVNNMRFLKASSLELLLVASILAKTPNAHLNRSPTISIECRASPTTSTASIKTPDPDNCIANRTWELHERQGWWWDEEMTSRTKNVEFKSDNSHQFTTVRSHSSQHKTLN